MYTELTLLQGQASLPSAAASPTANGEPHAAPARKHSGTQWPAAGIAGPSLRQTLAASDKKLIFHLSF